MRCCDRTHGGLNFRAAFPARIERHQCDRRPVGNPGLSWHIMDTPATTTLLAKMTSCSRPRTVTLTAWLVNGTSMIGTAALANLRCLAGRRLEGVLRAGGTAHPREVRRRGRYLTAPPRPRCTMRKGDVGPITPTCRACGCSVNRHSAGLAGRNAQPDYSHGLCLTGGGSHIRL